MLSVIALQFSGLEDLNKNISLMPNWSNSSQLSPQSSEFKNPISDMQNMVSRHVVLTSLFDFLSKHFVLYTVGDC